MLVKPTYFGTYKNTQGIVVFRHDDWDVKGWALYALPVYKKYGIAATFFMNTRVVIDIGQLAVDYAKELIKGRMEVASHFSRHFDLNFYDPSHVLNQAPLPFPMPEEELRLLLQEAVCDITDWGGARNGMVESNVTPWQKWNSLAQQVIPEYHTSSSHESSGPMPYHPLPDLMDCKSFIIYDVTPVSEVQATVQDCIANGKFVQLMFHNIEHNDGTKTQGSFPGAWLDTQLEDLCKWCDQQRRANPAKIIFPQMRDATRYMKSQGDYDYRVAKFSIEVAFSFVFPFVHVAPRVYNAAGEEILFSSVF